jgi:predicted Rdx family selenoprotein
VADAIKADLGLETTLIGGAKGEFTVWVGDEIVAEKENGEFPASAHVVAQVRPLTK